MRRNSENELEGLKFIRNSEWEILKDIQRNEREQHFANGKQEFSELRSSVFRTVREEFKDRWNDYFEARRNGADADTLKALKAGITADQKAALEPRRDAACKELRAKRDAEYIDLKKNQEQERQALRWHQQLGLDTSDFFDRRKNERNTDIVTEDFGVAARQVAQPRAAAVSESHRAENRARGAGPASKDEPSLGGLGSFGGSLLGSLFLHLANGGSPPPEHKPKSGCDEEIRLAAEEATKHREKAARDLDEEESRQKSRAYSGRE